MTGRDEIFDFVVVGAGASGCAVAERLASIPRNAGCGARGGARRAAENRSDSCRDESAPTATPFYDWKLVSQPDPTRLDRTEKIGQGASAPAAARGSTG